VQQKVVWSKAAVRERQKGPWVTRGVGVSLTRVGFESRLNLNFNLIHRGVMWWTAKKREGH